VIAEKECASDGEGPQDTDQEEIKDRMTIVRKNKKILAFGSGESRGGVGRAWLHMQSDIKLQAVQQCRKPKCRSRNWWPLSCTIMYRMGCTGHRGIGILCCVARVIPDMLAMQLR
jgi:hypothetical protein